MTTANITTTPTTQDVYDPHYPYPYNAERERLLKFIGPLWIDDDTFFNWIHRIFKLTCSLSITTSGLGSITNIINIIIFYRQGILEDSSTSSLVGMAVSDFLYCFLRFLTGAISVLIVLSQQAEGAVVYNIEGYDVTTDTLVRFYILPIAFVLRKPTFVILEFNTWVTTYLTFERMIGVTFPFLVKRILTPKRSCAVIIAIFIATTALQIPRLLNDKLAWNEFPNLNGTLVLSIVSSGFMSHELVNEMAFVNKTILRTISITMIIIFNAIIIIKVNVSQRFRKSKAPTTKLSRDTANQETSSNVSDHGASIQKKKTIPKRNAKTKNKELRLIRMLYVLSLTFLVSRVPNSLFMLMYKIQVGISDYWRSAGLHYAIYFYFTLDMIGRFLIVLNAASNTVIYLTMSSRYKKEFYILFPCLKKNV